MDCPECKIEMKPTSAVGQFVDERIESTFTPHCGITTQKFIGFKLLQCPKCKYTEIKPWINPEDNPIT